MRESNDVQDIAFFGHVGTMPIMIEILAVGFVVLVQIISFTVWLSKIGQKVEGMRKKCEGYDMLIERVATMEGRMEPYVKRESPLVLTEKGEKVLEKSGAKKYIESNKENLIKGFEHIDIPLDIQEKAKHVMNEKLREDNAIKDYVFREGEDMDNLAMVAGIELRDIVFAYKGITIERSGGK